MDPSNRSHFAHEARALLDRLNRISRFSSSQTMVPAANVSRDALRAIERHLAKAVQGSRSEISRYLDDLESVRTTDWNEAMAQRRLVLLRLKFGLVTTQVDMFDDVLSQRGANENGLWLAGLDVLARDAMTLPSSIEAPPVVCYLDRGVGAAIRRARTRLPGGELNPVAIIRVPRERLVGSGIASSLVHEVGHQVSVLTGMLDDVRQSMFRMEAEKPALLNWGLWQRWLSEILSDLWAASQLGVGATLGLINVVSLPSAFVFRRPGDDPHPVPWLRVLISAAMGNALYPDAQWRRLENLWTSMYPPHGLVSAQSDQFAALREEVPIFVDLLLSHQLPMFGGQSLKAALSKGDRRPAWLRRAELTESNRFLFQSKPTVAMAALSQARMEERLAPERDGKTVNQLLRKWAIDRMVE